MYFDEIVLSYLGGTENNCLSGILDMHNSEVNELQIIRRSSYHDYDKFEEFAKRNKDRFNIKYTSINSKFSELELFVEYLDSIDFKFNVICRPMNSKSSNRHMERNNSAPTRKIRQCDSRDGQAQTYRTGLVQSSMEKRWAARKGR